MLTKEQKELLKQIINDKFSVGAFSGMIYNQLVATNRPIDELVQQALMVRLRLKTLSTED